jgi:hypothetical protein
MPYGRLGNFNPLTPIPQTSEMTPSGTAWPTGIDPIRGRNWG